jgi:hypothetical protein
MRVAASSCAGSQAAPLFHQTPSALRAPPPPAQIPPGGTQPCLFKAKLADGAAGGAVVATVTDGGSGKQVESAPSSFSFDGAPVVKAPDAPTCATATTVRAARPRFAALLGCGGRGPARTREAARLCLHGSAKPEIRPPAMGSGGPE